MKKYIMYLFFLFTVITVALSNCNCKKKTPTKPGTPPKASFTVSPDSGDIFTTFYVDASTSSDAEDDTSELQVRWDWQGDDIWDTEYTTVKADSHKYATGDVHNITLQVKDSDGWTDKTSHMITVGGPYWHVIESPTTNTLNSVYFVNENDGWAVGAEGTILHYDGSEWSIVGSPTTENLWRVQFPASDNGWAIPERSSSGAVYHYDGSGWEIDTVLSGYMENMFFLDSENGWIVLCPFYKSSSSKYFGSVLYYDGLKWSAMPYTQGFSLYSVYFLNKDDGWISGYYMPNDDLFAHYNGTEWEFVSAPYGGMMYAMYFFSSSDGWAAGQAGLIFHYDGNEWTHIMPSGNFGTIWSIHFTSPQEGWAVGGYIVGTILHYDGSEWFSVNIPETGGLNSVYFTSPTNGWAVGGGGTILHYARD